MNKLKIISKENICVRYLLYIFIFLLLFVIRRHKVLLVLPSFLAGVTLLLNKKIYINKIRKYYILFWIYYIFISMISYLFRVSNNDIAKIVNLFLTFSIVISIMIIIPNKVESKEKLLCYLRNFGILISIIGVIEFITKKSFFYNIILASAKDWQINQFGTSNFRIFTIFLHPIVYGMFLLIIFCINYYYRPKNYYVFYIYQILILFNIYATQSRSSWISLIVVIIINIFRSKKVLKNEKNKNNLNKIIIIFLLILFILIFKDNLLDAIENIVNRFEIAFDTTNYEGSRIQRIGAINNIIKFCSTNLYITIFGGGIGYNNTFMELNPIYYGFNHVDNQFFSIILNSGIIGLVLFLSPIIIIMFKKYYKLGRINNLSLIVLLSMYICLFFYEGLSWQTAVFLITVFICLINDCPEKENSNE